jgi:hypothetical protein
MKQQALSWKSRSENTEYKKSRGDFAGRNCVIQVKFHSSCIFTMTHEYHHCDWCVLINTFLMTHHICPWWWFSSHFGCSRSQNGIKYRPHNVTKQVSNIKMNNYNHEGWCKKMSIVLSNIVFSWFGAFVRCLNLCCCIHPII